MIVLEKALSKVYPEIDIVTTPTGKPVAMVHCNTCTSDLNAWIGLFQEFTRALGVEVDQSRLFEVLYQQALAGDADGGGLLAYNYFSGEVINALGGRSSIVRSHSRKPFHAFEFHAHAPVLGARCIKDGLDILFEQEQVKIDQVSVTVAFQNKASGSKDHGSGDECPRFRNGTAGEGGAWELHCLPPICSISKE